jgi:membrane-associated phospholipid phosphatase
MTTKIRQIERVLVRRLAIAAAAAALFAKLLDSVREDDTVVHFDHRVAMWVMARRTATNVEIMRAITRLADSWTVAVVVALSAAVLVALRRRVEALILVASSAGSAVLVDVTKLVVGRSRPPAAEAVAAASGYAFPSGHAAQSVACYCGLAVAVWQLLDKPATRAVVAVGAIVTTLLVGLSRVWLGVHWASDVLAGWSVGAAWLGLLSGGDTLRRRRNGRVSPPTAVD